MEYKVVTAFMDLKDNNYGYQAGDTYPREGLEPTDERIKELESTGNKRRIPLIEREEEPETAAEPETAEPEEEVETAAEPEAAEPGATAEAKKSRKTTKKVQ